MRALRLGRWLLLLLLGRLVLRSLLKAEANMPPRRVIVDGPARAEGEGEWRRRLLDRGALVRRLRLELLVSRRWLLRIKAEGLGLVPIMLVSSCVGSTTHEIHADP